MWTANGVLNSQFAFFHISVHIDHNVLYTSRVEMLMQLLNGASGELISVFNIWYLCVCVRFIFVFCFMFRIKIHEIAFSVKNENESTFSKQTFFQIPICGCARGEMYVMHLNKPASEYIGNYSALHLILALKLNNQSETWIFTNK